MTSLYLKQILFSTIIILLSNNLLGQKTVGDNTGLRTLMTSGNAIKVFDNNPVKVEGIEYLNEDWLESYIYVDNLDEPITLPVKYDFVNQKILARVQNENVFEISSNVIDRIVQFKGNYDSIIIINSDKYNKSEFIPTLLLMLVEDNFSLAVHYNGEYLLPNYNPALDTGTKNLRVNVKKKYYLINKDRIYQLPVRRKKIIQFIYRFIDYDTKPNLRKSKFKNEEDLIDFFEMINN